MMQSVIVTLILFCHFSSVYQYTVCVYQKISSYNMWSENYTTESKSIMEDFNASTPGISAEVMINMTEGSSMPIVPGKTVKLPVNVPEDKTNSVIYRIHVKNTSNVTVFNQKLSSGFTSNGEITVFGSPGDSAVLELATIMVCGIPGESTVLKMALVTETVFMLPIMIQQCPPGFIFSSELRKCTCINKYESDKKLKLIDHCHEENYTAYLTSGLWIGYDTELKYGTEKTLEYSHCPYGQCHNHNSSLSLPSTTSVNDLNEIICGESREGRLCGVCRSDYALQYHDDHTKTCKKVKNCKWGWFLYLLSEILPVTLFFSFLMIFNIKLTSGCINGFILYCQISCSISIHGNIFIHFPKYIEILLDVYYKGLAGLWNLRFFEITELSFCLWRSATTMDLLAFRYITIFYSLFLVLFFVVVIKYGHNKNLLNYWKITTKTTVIHGISGFLILCYWSSVSTSLKILAPVAIYGKNEEGEFHAKYQVPFYGGHLKYFHEKHLYYAIPALLILFFLGMLPPLILLSYPLCYKVFSIFKIAESKFVSIFCTIIPLEKFKPFFDSFQHSFKDEYRFFSGLYFLYRFTLLLSIYFSDFTKFFYGYIELQLILMLAVHAICQPYKRRWHNVLDTLLFTDLTIINTIALVNYYHTVNLVNAQYYINIGSTLQIVLLYLPILYIAVYIIRKIITKLKQWRRKTVSSESNHYFEMTDSIQLRKE